MKKGDRESYLELEGFFLGLTEELFKDDEHWFESGQSHGLFTPALTMWLMMLQVLHKGSLSDAVKFIEEGLADRIIAKNARSKKARKRSYSTRTGAYSQARSRLEPTLITDVVAELTKLALLKTSKSTAPVVCLDGTALTLSNNKDIITKYPLRKNSHGACLPQMRLVFSTDVHTGVASNPSFDSHLISEQKLCARVLDQQEPGTIVISDRNFGIFSVVSHSTHNNLEVITRLTNSRAKRILGKSIPKTGVFDVTWTATRHDQLLDPADPAAVSGRIICSTLKKKGFPPIHLVLFTTTNLPIDKVIELYGLRQHIENDIRQLKVTLQTDYIMAKSKDMVEKELLVRFAAYNLIRSIINKAAYALKISPRDLSFKGMLQNIILFAKLAQKTTSPTDYKALWLRFLKRTSEATLPKRPKPRPSYPRRVIRNKRNFPLTKI